MVDASSRAELLYLLRDLRERFGITFLYITHDIATARHFAQRIVVMYLGRIVESGPAATIIDNPRHPYTQALIAAVPEPDPANRLQPHAVLPGEPPDPSHAPSGCSFARAVQPICRASVKRLLRRWSKSSRHVGLLLSFLVTTNPRPAPRSGCLLGAGGVGRYRFYKFS